MLLAVDIGNTHTVAGLYAGDDLRGSWRLASRREITVDEVFVFLKLMLADAGGLPHDSIVASVVPALTAAFLAALERLTGVEPLEVAPGIRTGLKIRVDNPLEVGADRIVNAAAAFARYGGPTIVVDLGTATTFDVVTGEGDYVGGIITPGPQLGADALSQRAARLPRVDLVVPARAIGRNTLDAVRSGLVYGHAAMVDGLVARIEGELGQRARVVLTGGLAGLIAPLLARVDASDNDLTLEGLRLIYGRNRTP